MKIAVVGAGSWGTAMAAMLGEKYQDIVLWARNSQLAAAIEGDRENKKYLSGVKLPTSIRCMNDIRLAVKDAKVIILVIPSHAMREIAKSLCGLIEQDAILVSAAKGFEISSLKYMTEVISEELPQHRNFIAAISGPNHAEEVGLKYPSASVIGCPVRAVAEKVQEVFMLPYFRAYINPDMIGVELGGALKNIIALGAGISEGLGYGDNTKSALMTRGIAEITRLGIAMGAQPLTFAGLAGVGDLIATCTSKHSRNRWAGTLLAQGKTVDQIIGETHMVVEGIRSTKAAYLLAKKYNVEMPITQQTYEVLYEGKTPSEAVLELMTRGKAREVEEVVMNYRYWKEE